MITRDTFLDAYLVELRDAWPGNPKLADDVAGVARTFLDGKIADWAIDRSARKAWKRIGGKGRVSLTVLRSLPIAAEPSIRASDRTCQLDKRAYLPFIVASSCPQCSRREERDLSGDDHLNYPIIGQPSTVYFSCERNHASVEWEVNVRVDVTLTIVSE
jgi:hypothetical protein